MVLFGITVVAFEKAGLNISMTLSKPKLESPNVTKIIAKFTNSSSTPMTGLTFQTAVPKYLKLEMQPPSSTTIPIGTAATVTQESGIANSMHGEKNIMLKIKLAYEAGGKKVEEMAQITSFPPLF